MSQVTINIPCRNKPRGRKVIQQTASGSVAFFQIGERKVKFILQHGHDGKPQSLVHFASGMIFGRLNEPKLSHALRYGTYTSLNDRGAAETLIARAVAAKGAEFVLGVMDAAPVINH